ncbi:hypothetical protein Lser_V15G23757 [Lactuca serriola]
MAFNRVEVVVKVKFQKQNPVNEGVVVVVGIVVVGVVGIVGKLDIVEVVVVGRPGKADIVVGKVKVSGFFFTKRPRPNPNESGEGCSQTPITNQSIPFVSNSNGTPQTPITNQSTPSVSNAIPQTPCSNEPNDNVDLKDLPKDRTDRPKITSYKRNVRDDCFAQEIHLSIRQEIGVDVFALLVDESSDVSRNEQMTIVLRYVDSLGFVKERFIVIVHVNDTSSLTLKNAINEILTSNKLTFSQIRGQGYDGASNMQREFNGLKALILQENDIAFYIHCFAHQLQLVVIVVAKKHDSVSDFFEQISLVVNVVCASCKRKDLLQEQARERVQKGLCSGELEIRGGLKSRDYTCSSGRYKMGFTFQHTHKFNKIVCECSCSFRMYEKYHDRFTETSTQLLEYMGALSHCDSFAQFNKLKLLELTKLYKYNFDDSDLIDLEGQLEIFYHSCIKDEHFTTLKGISELSRLMT